MNIVDQFCTPETKEATEGNPLPTMEFCHECGRIVKTDQYSKVIDGKTVYYCSEFCYHDHSGGEKSKYGTGQSSPRNKYLGMNIDRWVEPEGKPYNRQEREELLKHFTRVFETAVSKPGYKYKKKGTYGPFFSEEEALKILRKIQSEG